MNFDEIIDAMPPGDSLDCQQMAASIDFLLDADDFPTGEREAFIAGYIVGMTYALAAHNEDKISEAANRLMDLMAHYLD